MLGGSVRTAGPREHHGVGAVFIAEDAGLGADLMVWILLGGEWDLFGKNEAISISYKPDGAQGRNRTTDTVIFSHMLYQLSYLGLLPTWALDRRS
jgi:hypothetical protein